jgi:hypothetical protein
MKKEEKKPEVAKEEPKVDNTVDKLKVKKPKAKLKKFAKDNLDNTVKIDLKELAAKADDVVKVDTKKPVEEIKPVEKPEAVEKVEEKKEAPLLEEIKEVKSKDKKIPEPPKVVLPENVEKLMNFMNDTGGDINDYVNLNKDYSKMDNDTLLREYYKNTKPHLSDEEINFVIEDRFLYDEDSEQDIDIKRKKLALKEQVAQAKNHLDGLKSKYYEDLKAGSRLTQDQQKAIEFYNNYNEESAVGEKMTEIFLNKTNEVFDDEFKGFEYEVGDKRYRYNVNNADEIKVSQSDINNFVRKFLNDKNEMADATGYHKSLYTAMNADSIANHFYEQGKADALRDSAASAKNVDMDPRQSHTDRVDASGMKFRALDDDTGFSKFTFKKKK